MQFSGGGSFSTPNSSDPIISFEHVLTTSELTDIAALSSEHTPGIVLYYSQESSDSTFLDANLRANFTADSIRLVKRPKAS